MTAKEFISTLKIIREKSRTIILILRIKSEWYCIYLSLL